MAGETLGGMLTNGEQQLFEVRGPASVHLWLAHVTWECGEREIRRTRRHDTLGWQDRLLGRQRLEIEAWGEGYCSIELGQAQLTARDVVEIREASEYELDAGARTCIRCALRAVGASSMGTRQEVLGVCDEDRHRLCVTFPEDAWRVPILAFALTRVAPLLARVEARRA